MRPLILKTRNLMLATNRFERAGALAEIRFNHLFLPPGSHKAKISDFDEFVQGLASTNPALFTLLRPLGEAEEAVEYIRQKFKEISGIKRNMPFPFVYNADRSMAMLCYSLTRCIKPAVVVETGVAYGLSTAVILLALERNQNGRLVSIDLPPLLDPNGFCVGMAVPSSLKHRWILHLGSSRRLLPSVLSEIGEIGLFIGDDATIYTLQKYEFNQVWPRLVQGGAVVIGDVGDKLMQFLAGNKSAQIYTMRQMEKPSCVTGLIFKN